MSNVRPATETPTPVVRLVTTPAALKHVMPKGPALWELPVPKSGILPLVSVQVKRSAIAISFQNPGKPNGLNPSVPDSVVLLQPSNKTVRFTARGVRNCPLVQLGELGEFQIGTLTYQVFSQEVVNLLQREKQAGLDGRNNNLNYLLGERAARPYLYLSTPALIGCLIHQGVIEPPTTSEPIIYSSALGVEAWEAYLNAIPLPEPTAADEATINKMSCRDLELYIEDSSRRLCGPQSLISVLKRRALIKCAQEKLAVRRPPQPQNLEGFEGFRFSRSCAAE